MYEYTIRNPRPVGPYINKITVFQEKIWEFDLTQNFVTLKIQPLFSIPLGCPVKTFPFSQHFPECSQKMPSTILHCVAVFAVNLPVSKNISTFLKSFKILHVNLISVAFTPVLQCKHKKHVYLNDYMSGQP